jgi:hypothetical protein
MAEEAGPAERKSFTFHALEHKYGVTEKKDMLESFEKWGLARHSALYKFRYDELLKPYDLENFLVDFFSSMNVRAVFRTISRSGAWSFIGSGPVTKVTFDTLNCNQTSMEFFDRLVENGVVRKNGYISKMLEEDVEGVVVYDKLQQLFVDQACETWESYSADDRKELLFQIMQHLSLGGGVNQYDDMIAPYQAAARELYKDLVTVVKNTSTGKLEVMSTAVRIRDVEGLTLWPFDALQNFCFLTIDPIKRHVNVWYGAYVPPW